MNTPPELRALSTNQRSVLCKPIRSQYYLVNVGEQKREKDEEAEHGEDDTKEHLERSEKKLTP